MKKVWLALVLFATVTLIHDYSYGEWDKKIFQFDVAGYYVYLPATFIYQDLQRVSFYPYVDSTYAPSPGGTWYALFEQPTGKRANKYPMGVAIGELPFFLLAHAYTLYCSSEKPDGYTRAYRYAICAGTLVWALLGLYYLGRFLVGVWGANVATITVLLIGLGTNLFCYSITAPGMSHVWLFLLFSLVLYATLRWHSTGEKRYIYCLAVCCALILISRPSDGLIVLLPFAWGVTDKHTFWQKWETLRRARWHLLLSAIIFLGIVSLQLLYWRSVTGHFFHYSYKDEYFDFTDAEIIRGLFGYGKGWFVYTPIALFGILGIVPLYKRSKSLGVFVLLYFAATIYIIFSWHEWWYGWGFGCRPLIESLTVLSIPLAALVTFVLKQRIWIRALAALVGAFLIWLNIYQTNQFMTLALPGKGITKAYYWRMWNRMHADEEDKKLLR